MLGMLDTRAFDLQSFFLARRRQIPSEAVKSSALERKASLDVMRQERIDKKTTKHSSHRSSLDVWCNTKVQN